MKPTIPLLAAALALTFPLSASAADDSAGALQQGFLNPPLETRPMVRWWWFGPAVVKPQLEREIRLMKEGGFGGFEVQPTYPLAVDGQYPGLKNLKFLSPEFSDMLRFTAEKAREIGVRMDLTLGSGWPYGGPMFSREEAVQSIADAGSVTLTPGQTTVSAPDRAGRRSAADAPVVAALLGPIKGADGQPSYLPLKVEGRSAILPSDLRGATEVRFFVYAPANLMQVKRAAYGAEGHIVDHYAAAPLEKFIREIAQPEIAACGPNAPYSLFCDSLEMVGEGWTPAFPQEFQKRRGYDLMPVLPALFDSSFPNAAEIRGDYGRTVVEVFNDTFVDRFTKLAHDAHSRFRLQAYGTPPTTLSTYARVDISEGENYNWRAFSGTRWAASASHLLGRAETSSEAFTWLHSPVFMAAPVDIKAESNLQFLNGVNHLLFHGWPYTAPGVEYPGWRFYAAAVFNEKNPWWIVMPDITAYLARTSFLLCQGQPVNDVALYLPEEDAFAMMTPSSLQMVGAGGNGILNRLVNPVVPSILDAGFNFDGIDYGILASHGRVEGATLAFGAVRYRAVILPNQARITPSAFRTLETFANQGGVLIAVGAPPSLAPGYRATAADQQAVRDIADRLFKGPAARGVVVALDQVSATLRAKLQPDVVLPETVATLGFVHRRTADADIYFIANTSNQPVSTTATLRVAGRNARWWDATTAKSIPARTGPAAKGSTSVSIELPPYGAQFLVFSGEAAAPAPSATASAETKSIELGGDWDVSFKNASSEPDPARLHVTKPGSWTEEPALKYFSGVGSYTKTIEVPADLVQPGRAVEIDFGNGDPVTLPRGMGMRADFQPPVADAAVVYVNGRRAGSAWCPPYRVDVTGLLHAGPNELRIDVANRAVNFMADQTRHPLPDYRELNADPRLGGNRFQPQDMNQIQVVPSGLLKPVTLRSHPAAN